MAEYILKLDIDESELGRKLKKVLGGMNVGGGGGQVSMMGGGANITPAQSQKLFEAALKKLTLGNEKLQKAIDKQGVTQKKGLLGQFGPQLFKLAGIAMGVGALIQVGKSLIDASPLLQAMHKIFSTALTLFLRPIGDFFAMLLRPFITLMLKYAISFYRDFGPKFIAAGTAAAVSTGITGATEAEIWDARFETLINIIKANPGFMISQEIAELLKGMFRDPTVHACPGPNITPEQQAANVDKAIEDMYPWLQTKGGQLPSKTFEEKQSERREKFEEERSRPGLTYEETQTQITQENKEKNKQNVLERERAEAIEKQLAMAEKTNIFGPEAIYGNFAKKDFETGGYTGGYTSEQRKQGYDRLEGVLGIAPGITAEELQDNVTDAIDCICDFWNNAACILTLIETGPLAGMDRETKLMLEHIVRMKKAGKTMADFTTKTGESIQAAYIKMLQVLKSLQIRAGKNDATAAQKQFGGSVCACQVVCIQTSGGFGQQLSGFRGSNGKVYRSIGEALANNPHCKSVIDINTGQKYRYVEPQKERGAIEEFAHGGILTEPVLGVGQRTGKQYLLGERGPEAVVPLEGGGMSEMSGPINVTFNVNGVFNSSDFESSVKPMVLRWFKEVKANRGII